MRRRSRAVVVVAGLFVVFLAGVGVGRSASHGDVDAGTPSAGPDGQVVEPGQAAPAVRAVPPPDASVRSEEGAVAAAVRYAVLLDGPALLDDDARRAAIEEVAASGAEDELADSLGAVAEVIVSGLRLTPDIVADPGFVWRPVPAGWQIRSYDDEEAVVALWGTAVWVMEGRQLQQPGWRTVEVELRWERDQWRMVRMRSEDGPAPPLAGTTGVGAVGREIARFDEFVHWPAPEGG